MIFSFLQASGRISRNVSESFSPPITRPVHVCFIVLQSYKSSALMTKTDDRESKFGLYCVSVTAGQDWLGELGDSQ